MVRQKKKNISKNKRASSVSSLLYPDFSIHSASEAELPLWRELAENLFPNSSIEMETDDALLLAFSNSHQPIGFVHLHPQPSAILLAGIGVIPRWQGRGVGRALMEAAMQRAQKEWPSLPFQLEVKQANPAALRLYASWGFALTRFGAGTFQLRRAALN